MPRRGRRPQMTVEKPIRVLLADDHRLVRCALAQLIDSFAGITVVADIGSSRHLIETVANTQPDVVLVDATMFPPGEPDVVRQTTEAHPRARLATLSMYASDAYIHRILERGICGFIHKDAGVEDLENAIRRIAAGEIVVHAGLALSELDTVKRARGPVPSGGYHLLTARQTEVLTLIASGYRSKEIAEHLSVSVKTVESHRSELMRRLGVHNMAGLIQAAIRAGLVPSG